MIKKIGLFYLAMVLIGSMQPVYPETEVPAQESDFNSNLQKAFAYGNRGQWEKSVEMFENLLTLQSKEWIVYDLYTMVLEWKGDYDAVEKIYQRAMENLPQRTEEIRRRMEVLQTKREFKKAMQSAGPWETAKVFGSTEFAVKTNIPAQYYQSVGEKIGHLLEQEKNLLAEIFGPPEGELSTILSVVIFGRGEEYMAYNESKRGKGSYSVANYDDKEKELIIYFTGQWDWRKVSHEMAHHLIRELYIKHPSRFVDEGIAEYVSIKLEKENGKAELISNLEFMNWLYDQGLWEHAFDIFFHWKNYEMHPDRYAQSRIFYLISWSLVGFFIEDGSSHDFFKEYLRYEQQNDFNNIDTTHKYFSEHLSESARKDLDAKWGKFCLGLNYQKV